MKNADVHFHTAKERAEEESFAIIALLSSDGWRYMQKWLDDQNRAVQSELYTCPLDKVDRLRGELYGYNKLISYVQRFIK